MNWFLKSFSTAIFASLLTLTNAWAAGPYGSSQCAASRFGSSLGCTANDVSINNIAVSGTPPSSCVGGQTLPLDLAVTVNFGSASRYNIGVFVSNDGKDPSLLVGSGGAATCSVAVLPNTSPFLNLDSNACGDGNGSINGNTGSGSFIMTGVAIPCTTNGSGATTLYIPYLISWDQSSGTCSDNTYPVPGTSSKCNTGTVSFPPGTTIVVLPKITITDGITTAVPGGTNTYTIVITNTTGSPLSNAVFTSPAISNLSVSSVSCTAGGGSTCPASSTVSAMQGAGITLPTMPINSTLTFTVTGTVGTPSTPTTLVNTASVTVSSKTNSASDSDVLPAPPSATKSFSPSIVAPGAATTLTVTLTNPNTGTAVSGLAFTDNYPSGMTNSSSPGLTNTCGGTATAAANGALLSLSGGTIAANSSCSISVNVTSTATGVNSLGTVSTTNTGSRSAAASGTLLVLSATNSTVVASPTSVPNDNSTTSTITVTLKDTAGNPVAGRAITLTAGSGSSTITTLVGTTNASGQATFSVKDGVQEAVTYTATDATSGLVITQTATVTYSSVSRFNAFETSTTAGAIAGSIYTKLAGTAFSLDLVAISGSSQASGFSNNVKVELLANTGTAGSGYGADNCPVASTVIQTISSTAISGGRSAVNFAAVTGAYQDVRVRISYPTTSPTISVCSTDNFAIRPSAASLTTSANAVGPSATATPVIKAGASFTLGASTSAGSSTYAGTLTQDASKLTAQTTSQDTSAQSGGVVGTLGATSLTANATSINTSYSEVGYLYLAPGAYRDDTYTTVDSAAGDCVTSTASDANLADTLSGGKYGCSIGNKTAVSLGRFIPDHFGITTTGGINASSSTLTVASTAGISNGLTISVMGAGVGGIPLTTTVSSISGNNITLAAAASATVSNASVVLSSLQTRADLATSGSSFTYMDEPMKLTLRLIAFNAAENITQNYAGSFAKITASTLGTGSNWFNTGCTGTTTCYGLGAANSTTGLSNRLTIDTSIASPSSSWTSGIGTFTAYATFSKNSTPDGPYQTLKIGAMPRDSDGVTLPDAVSSDTNHRIDFDATTGNTLASNPDSTIERRLQFITDVRFGRLWLGNAYGSDKLNLNVPFELQYWNGTTFVKNTADNGTVISSTNIVLGNKSGGLGAYTGPISVSATSAGAGIITLTKPASSAAGSVDLMVNLGATGSPNNCSSLTGGSAASLSYLSGRWCGNNYDRNPTARATFGISGGSSGKRGQIYLRESY